MITHFIVCWKMPYKLYWDKSVLSDHTIIRGGLYIIVVDKLRKEKKIIEIGISN